MSHLPSSFSFFQNPFLCDFQFLIVLNHVCTSTTPRRRPSRLVCQKAKNCSSGLGSGLPCRRVLADVGHGDDDHLIIRRLVTVNDQILRPPNGTNAVTLIRPGVQLRPGGDAFDGGGRRALKPARRLGLRASYQATASSKSATARRSSRTLATGRSPRLPSRLHLLPRNGLRLTGIVFRRPLGNLALPGLC
jgi:hypothetical protein